MRPPPSRAPHGGATNSGAASRGTGSTPPPPIRMAVAAVGTAGGRTGSGPAPAVLSGRADWAADRPDLQHPPSGRPATRRGRLPLPPAAAAWEQPCPRSAHRRPASIRAHSQPCRRPAGATPSTPPQIRSGRAGKTCRRPAGATPSTLPVGAVAADGLVPAAGRQARRRRRSGARARTEGVLTLRAAQARRMRSLRPRGCRGPAGSVVPGTFGIFDGHAVRRDADGARCQA